MQPLYIDNTADLTAFCQRLQGAPFVALDTEFMREKTYYPQLCLIQIATEEVIACIDPLACDSLDPLLDVLYDPATVKVLHAAHQDLEILHLLRGVPPAPIFDTQLAATLLGQGEQVGYGNLVKEVLGVELDKAHSRADWSLRPLTAEQIDYAADDVRYLVQVYLRQREALLANGRLDWLAEDFAALTNPDTFENPPLQAWRRVKGLNFLKGVQLAVLQQLAAWRESTAQASDRPRRWILKDEVVHDMARHMPDSLDKMARIRGLEKGVVDRHGRTLLGLIQQARQLPKEQWPHLELPPRLSAEQDAIADAMMALSRLRAQQHKISPGTLASRRDIEQLLGGDAQATLRHGWRAELIGHELERLLRGEITLRVEDGRLRADPAPG